MHHVDRAAYFQGKLSAIQYRTLGGIRFLLKISFCALAGADQVLQHGGKKTLPP